MGSGGSTVDCMGPGAPSQDNIMNVGSVSAKVVDVKGAPVADMAAHLYPFLPVRLQARFRYDALDYVSQVSSPVLIVHSRDDEMIPFAQGRRLFEAAGEPKRFLEIRGSHNEGFLVSAERYEEGLASFLAAHLGP